MCYHCFCAGAAELIAYTVEYIRFLEVIKMLEENQDLIIWKLTYGMLSAMVKQSLSWHSWQYTYALLVHLMQGLFVDLDQKQSICLISGLIISSLKLTFENS
jgi:hypothetical protein